MPSSSSTTVLYSSKWASEFRPIGAYVSEIQFKIFEDDIPQAMIALQNGDIDVFNERVSQDYVAALVKDPNIEVTFSSSTRYRVLTLDCARFPTNITAFRRAMAYGYDKNLANLECIGGDGNPQDSYIPQSITEWEVESELLEHFYQPDYTSGNKSLESAGFKDLDSDGWREYDTNSNDLWDPGTDLDDDEYAGGGIIELYAPAGYEPAIRASEIMADGLEKMGIRAYVWPSEFHVFPPPDIHDFLVNCWTEGVSVVNPPRILYDNFRTGAKYNSPADPDNNWYHFSNSSIDSVLDQMIEASSLEDVKTYAREANRLLAFEQPQIVVYNDININAYRTDMFDGWFEFSGVGIASGGYYENNPYCATKVHLADCSFGETLNYGLSDELRTLNPYLQYTRYEETVYQYIYERLWNIDPFTWDSIPGLAYDWKIEETTANGTIQDGQKFTFYLYENETWHDGKPFTAADVNHSLHMWRKSPRSSPEMANVYKVDLPNGSNGYNIELYVNETACFEWADTTRFYITPEHIWRDVTNVSALIPTDNQIIGTGPYKWNEYVPGESISLLRHEDWRWDIRDVPISPSSSSVEGSSIQMTTTQQSSISENTPGFTLVILSSVLLIKRPKRKRNS